MYIRDDLETITSITADLRAMGGHLDAIVGAITYIIYVGVYTVNIYKLYVDAAV
jgi:hypothetical protein